MADSTDSARERIGGGRPGAWVRLGGAASEGRRALEIGHAVGEVGTVVLEPWETAAAHRLKSEDPAVVVLCRRRTLIVDESETGPVHSNGLSYDQAEANGWVARSRAEEAITWGAHPGQWQLRIWDPACRTAWTEAIVRELSDSPFDGVLADDLDLDDHACTGLFVAVIGVYGDDLQAAGDELATIAIDTVSDLLGVTLGREVVEIRVDDIEER